MDIARAAANVFADRRWFEKIGIGSLIMIVPILNFAAFGYQVRVARQAISGSASEMPDWDDLLSLWREGVWLALARAVYALPFLFILAVSAIAGVPFIISLDRNPEASWIPLLLVCGVGVILMISYGAVVGILWPAMLGTYVRRGTFAACFDFPEFFHLIGRSVTVYLTLWLMILAMGILYCALAVVLLLPVSLIPFLGQALVPLLQSAAIFLTMLVQASLVGQWLRVAEKPEADASPVLAAE